MVKALSQNLFHDCPIPKSPVGDVETGKIAVNK